MDSRSITFTNRRGFTLSGRLDQPANEKPAAWVLFAHCFTCGSLFRSSRDIAAALVAQGFGVLRFDFTGLGDSEGEFAEGHFGANQEDLADASEFLRNSVGQGPSLLVGHSLGGAAVLAVAGAIEGIRAVATIGAPSDPAHVQHLFAKGVKALQDREVAEVKIAGRTFAIDRRFVDELERHSLQPRLASLKKPLLILHAPQDNVVGVDNAAELFQWAKHPKSFVSLDTADHLLSDPRDSRYVAAVIAGWASRYLELGNPEAEPERADLPEGVTATIGLERYKARIQAGRHRFVADEPADMGGADLGPAPYDWIAAGLAACTAMTLRMYADRKNWPLDEAEVEVRHEKDRDQQPPLDRFERRLKLRGELDPEQRQRLKEIAERCPVHRTLAENARKVDTLLLE